MSETHLQRRGGIWYYRRRVPRDLVSKFGKKVIQYSLETTVLSEAKKRCAVHDLKASAKFEHLRQSLSGGHTAVSDGIAKPAPVSELEIVRLVQRYVADQDERAEARLLAHPPKSQDEVYAMAESAETGLSIIQNRDDPRAEEWVYDASNSILANIGRKDD